MQHNETVITHRTQRFAFGRGPDFYGVWQIQADQWMLVDSAPKTSAGWYRAWARFNRLESGVEAPGSLPHVPDGHRHSVSPRLAIVLLLVGVGAGIAGLFPSYLSGASLAGQNDQLVEHVLFLAGWTVALAALAVRPRNSASVAAFAFGLSVTTFGFYFADLGTVISSGAHVAGAGLILTLFGWVLCTEGSVVAILHAKRLGKFGWPGAPHPAVVGVAAALGVGVVATFAPAWDSFRLYAVATGQTNVITAGNAFANPAAIIAANVCVMVVVVVIAVLAISWRPGFLGASLLAGALVPMVAQFVSALVQNATPPGPGTFGISAAQAAQMQLHISSGFTTVFYVYCAFVAGLVLFCAAWGWSAHNEAMPVTDARPNVALP